MLKQENVTENKVAHSECVQISVYNSKRDIFVPAKVHCLLMLVYPKLLISEDSNNLQTPRNNRVSIPKIISRILTCDMLKLERHSF